MSKLAQPLRHATICLGILALVILWSGLYLFCTTKHDASLHTYAMAGAILSGIVLIVTAAGAAQEAQRRASERSLEHSNVLLHTALANMAHDVCMFDRDQCLVVCNARYAEMYNLPPEQIKPGTTLKSILNARVRAGISPADGEQ